MTTPIAQGGMAGYAEQEVGGDEIAARAIGFAQKYGTPLSPTGEREYMSLRDAG